MLAMMAAPSRARSEQYGGWFGALRSLPINQHFLSTISIRRDNEGIGSTEIKVGAYDCGTYQEGNGSHETLLTGSGFRIRKRAPTEYTPIRRSIKDNFRSDVHDTW